MYKTDDTECLVMLDQPHPSWVLVSHGDPTAVESFQRAMLALNALLRDAPESATLNEARLLETMANIERLRRGRVRVRLDEDEGLVILAGRRVRGREGEHADRDGEAAAREEELRRMTAESIRLEKV